MKKIYYNGHIIYICEVEFAKYIYIVNVDDSNHDTLEQAKSWIDHLAR
jgi:hypothetical protein